MAIIFQRYPKQRDLSQRMTNEIIERNKIVEFYVSDKIHDFYWFTIQTAVLKAFLQACANFLSEAKVQTGAENHV